MILSQWISNTQGHGYDIDGAYGVQCVDGFRKWCNDFLGYSWPTGNGWADGYWYYRYEHSNDFDFITDYTQYKDGDWVFWAKGSRSHPSSHVAMYYQGKEYGQNQSVDRAFCLKSTDFSDSLGAFRWKGWYEPMNIDYGASNAVINGHTYYLYKQRPDQHIGVLSAGLNKLKHFNDFNGDDEDITVYARVGGANYFQMSQDQYDPYGTTYGDLSAPLDGVVQMLPNQDSTLYYDLKSGLYGDCTDMYLDTSHDVFSPSLVIYQGSYQYARMVGINKIDQANYYSFVMRLADGYVLGSTGDQQLTPRTIADDLKNISNFMNVAILDGGGSAMMKRGYDDIRITDRHIPSVVAIYKEEVKVYDPTNGTDTVPELPSDDANDNIVPGTDDTVTSNLSLILQRLDELEKRIEELEKRNT